MGGPLISISYIFDENNRYTGICSKDAVGRYDSHGNWL